MEFENQSGIMIKNAIINNFRGIKECKVNNLSLVNLFIGRNNSRKSTLLDAIYIGCQEPIISSLKTVLKNRIEREVLPYEIFYNYDENSKAEVQLKYNNNYNYSIIFSIAEKEIELPEKNRIEKGQLYSSIYLNNSSYYITAYNKYKEPKDLELIPLKKTIIDYGRNATLFYPTIKKNELTDELDQILSIIKTKPQFEKDLIERMSDIYKEDIEDFEFEFIPRRESHKDKRVALGKDRIFSDFQGDGMQRALIILSTIELTTDSAVFIEEIEMFQHPIALKRLAKHTIELAKKNRIQLFITTHNFDAFVGYALMAGKNGFNNKAEQKELFRSYKLTNNDGIVDAHLENDANVISKELHSIE